jgi:hypothetical protein
MPLDLVDDVRNCKRRQLAPTREVEAVDCIDQPDGASLAKVVVVVAAWVPARASTSARYSSIRRLRAVMFPYSRYALRNRLVSVGFWLRLGFPLALSNVLAVLAAR